jgi:cytochrome c peroxidase
MCRSNLTVTHDKSCRSLLATIAATLVACGGGSEEGARNTLSSSASSAASSAASSSSSVSSSSSSSISSTASSSSVSSSSSSSIASAIPSDVLNRLKALSPAQLPIPLADVSNAYADNLQAAQLGKKFFFDPRFSGPLLNSDNTGAAGTLGKVGEAGKIACEGCHDASSGVFADTRSPRGELSLAASWTRRRTPSLLNVGHQKMLNWDGRRDAMYNQVFGVIESPLEFNSSRLFVAQQITRLYKAEYEAVFGKLPSLTQYAAIAPEQAGCEVLIEGPTPAPCLKPGNDDPNVLRILVNFGKAIGAYQRQLSCGSSRFDDWMHGNEQALTTDEKAGAVVFINAGCDKCHSGPYMTDQKFYNLGVANNQNTFFVPPFTDDPGAVKGIADARADVLNTQGQYSDGDDGRLSALPTNTDPLLGAFKTPGLRCVGRNSSFFHAALKRSLEDVVVFFNRGGDNVGYKGVKDASMVPLNLTPDERRQLVAFLRALDGVGPDAAVKESPVLPPN